MSILSAVGKNPEQKNKADSKSNVQLTISDMAQLPNEFHFWNGDEYTGQFTVFKDKQIIAMEGQGIYKTSDGHTYEGIWENDFLKHDCKITFPDKSVFSGTLDEMLIGGSGKYLFKERVQVEGEFINNNIIGKVYLKDPNQNIWRGKVDESEGFINFYPLHPFWQSVLNLPSKTFCLFYGEAEEENENLWENIN